ncbi:hypothetical protein [Rhizobium leguminosarum]|uniref:hypothetical protein n=1 Tax=Rhizobium leguminosarum TaxID=384 RepID=UPI0013E3E27E|nr:hypothetical protein [Rhizobium leguminosarum]
MSQIIAYMNSNNFPATVLAQAKRDVRDRVIGRLQAGRADCELTFNDIFDRLEASVIR